MIVKRQSFLYFVNYIKKENKQIICYGAGLVALSTEHLFEDSKIADRVVLFADRDEKKRGTVLHYSGRGVSVIGVDELLHIDFSDKILLLTLEVFGAVIEYLGQYSELRDIPCYIFTELNKSYIESIPTQKCDVDTKTKIPKIIHYAWLGGGEMTKEMLDYLASWKQYCPNYELVCWNEDNYDVYQNQYMRQSYKARKFAFTADFLRLDVLYRYGGIYLDTDVMLLKNLDAVLGNEAFAVYLEWAVPTFGIAGSIAGLPIIEELRDSPRSEISFINTDGSYNQKISSYYEVEVLEKYGFHKDFSLQSIQHLTMYPPHYFATNGRLGLNTEISETTYAIHYCHRTWADASRMYEINSTTKFATDLLKTSKE